MNSEVFMVKLYDVWDLLKKRKKKENPGEKREGKDGWHDWKYVDYSWNWSLLGAHSVFEIFHNES